MVAYLYFSRFAVAILTAIMVVLLYKNLALLDHPRVIIRDRIGNLLLKNDMKYTFIGRRRGSDIRLNDPSASRSAFLLERVNSDFCVMHRIGHGCCRKVGTNTNCEDSMEVFPGDKLKLGEKVCEIDILPGNYFSYTRRQALLLLLVTLVQGLLAGQLYVQHIILPEMDILVVFGGLILLEWLYCGLIWILKLKGNTLVEIIGLLLVSIGLAITGTKELDLLENGTFFFFSFAVFIISTWLVSKYENTDRHIKRKVSKVAALMIILMALILCFMPIKDGARISLILPGGFSMLLLPFTEILFLLVLADYDPLAPKEWNRVTMFLAVVVFCIFAALSVIRLNELGSLLIFIVLILIGVYLRTGNWLFLFGAGVMGVISIPLMVELSDTFANRLMIVGTALDADVLHRTQLTEAISLSYSGGLFGISPGAGQLADHVQAAESDLILAVLGEECGMVMLFIVIAMFALLAWFGIKNSYDRHFSMHVAACLASCLIVFKVLFGALGTYNMLPLSGLGIPLCSQSRVCMLVSWLLMSLLVQPFQKGCKYDQ